MARIDRTPDEIRVEIKCLVRAGRQIATALTFVALLALVFTMVNVTLFAAHEGVPWFIAWLLDPVASVALGSMILAEGVLARYECEPGRWVSITKWFSGLATWAMNVWAPAASGSVAGVVLHSVAPGLILLLAEATPRVRQQLAEIIAERALINVDTEEIQRVEDAVRDTAEVPVAVSIAGQEPTTYLYRLTNDGGDLLYVGVTWDLQRRIAEHRRSKSWWGKVGGIQAEAHPTRAGALAVERATVSAECPRYNARIPVGSTLVSPPTPPLQPTSDPVAEGSQSTPPTPSVVPIPPHSVGSVGTAGLGGAGTSTPPRPRHNQRVPPDTTSTLLAQAREVRRVRPTAGRRVLMAELGVTDRVARDLARILDQDAEGVNLNELIELARPLVEQGLGREKVQEKLQISAHWARKAVEGVRAGMEERPLRAVGRG